MILIHYTMLLRPLFEFQQHSHIGEVLLAGKAYEEITPFIPAMYTHLDKVGKKIFGRLFL